MNEPNKTNQDSTLIVTLSVGQLRELVRQELKAASETGNSSKLLTPEQLATALEVPISWVYEQSRLGKIPVHKVGHYNRYDLVEVLTSLKKN